MPVLVHDHVTFCFFASNLPSASAAKDENVTKPAIITNGNEEVAVSYHADELVLQHNFITDKRPQTTHSPLLGKTRVDFHRQI